MTKPTTNWQRSVAAAIRVLTAVEAVVYLLAAQAHLNGPIPLGISEPLNVPAGIAEGLCGIFFTVSAYALFTDKRWAWMATTGAHAFAVVAVIVGITALAAGRGPNTTANYIFHRAFLALHIAILALLATPPGKAALGPADA